MENSVFFFIFVIVFLLILIITLIVGVYYLYTQLRSSEAKDKTTSIDYEKKLQDILLKHQKEITKARQESVAISRHTIKGQIAEQLAPLLPGFPYTPSDSHFIGDPIDYIVFNGYTNFKDNKAGSNEFEVVIIDIKHNKAGLSPGQKAIATAIEEGKVRFEVIRIQEDGTIDKQKFFPSSKNKSSSI